MTPLNCESCDPLLLDLATDELDETTALAVRTHAEGCEACSRALARLTAGRRAARELVLAEPPALTSVLAAARARAAEVQAQAARASEPSAAPVVPRDEPARTEPPSGSYFEQFLRWIGAWAARPQVAMATVFVLMVGIGLWYVPQARWRNAADPDGMMVEPDTSGEVAPSSALAPAEPLALDVDPRTQRVALEEGGEQTVDVDERPITQLAEGEAVTRPPTARLREPRVGASDDDRATTEAQQQELLAVTEVPVDGVVGRVEDGPLPEVATSAPTETAIAIAPSAPAPTVQPAPEHDYYHPAPAPSAPAYGSSSSTTPSTSPAPSLDSYGLAREERSPAALLPNAIHRQAQSLASGGHCAEAVPRYESLLREHADYADAPRAMLELAECHRQLGHLATAATWIGRAERYPSVSADARRARVRIEAEISASERASHSRVTSESSSD